MDATRHLQGGFSSNSPNSTEQLFGWTWQKEYSSFEVSLKTNLSRIAKSISIYFLSIGRIVQWFFDPILMTGMTIDVIQHKL